MKWFGEAASCAVIIFATTGCGGNAFTSGQDTDSDAGDEAGAAPNADQACGDNAKARCTRIQQCSQALMATTYVDEGTCETRFKLSCLNSLAVAGTGNNPQATEACAAAYPTESCDDFLDDNPPAACLQVKGPRANGGTCGFPGQCQTGFCAIVPGSECGACAPVPQAGDSCTQLTTCGQLLSCWSESSLCTGFASQGGVCNKDQPCGAGLYCVGSTSTINGTCEPSVETLNAPCDSTAKTGPGCDRNELLTCSGVTDQCATVSFAGAGQPCGTVNEQLVLCAAAGTCTATTADAGVTTAATETCVAAAADGAQCDLVQGPFCITPARCISTIAGGSVGTCQFPDPTKCQ